jgi:thiol-disulfide isomerase/thioredoxin
MGLGFFHRRGKFPRPGDRLPSTPLLDGVLAGGGALLAFFKVSCPVCQLTFPFLERIAQAGTLRVIGVSQDDARQTGRFAREYGVTFPLLLDEESAGYAASNACGVSTVPSLFLVEPDGTVSYSGEGFIKRDLEDLGRRAGVEVFRQDEPVPAWQAG